MSRMFSALQQLAASAFMERLTLWLNHVIAGEDAAVQRLRPHAGRLVRLELSGWPTLLPPLPEISFGITPAARSYGPPGCSNGTPPPWPRRQILWSWWMRPAPCSGSSRAWLASGRRCL